MSGTRDDRDFPDTFLPDELEAGTEPLQPVHPDELWHFLEDMEEAIDMVREGVSTEVSNALSTQQRGQPLASDERIFDERILEQIRRTSTLLEMIRR